jgi:hypothetical protein
MQDFRHLRGFAKRHATQAPRTDTADRAPRQRDYAETVEFLSSAPSPWPGLPGRALKDRHALARSFVAKAVLGLATTAYFLFKLDRGSMPVVRSRFEQTSFKRKLRIYWEAWKAGRHVAHFGVKQIRVVTVTESRVRLNHMIDAVKEITDGKGSNFFLFAEKSQLANASAFGVQWTTGKGELIKLTD